MGIYKEGYREYSGPLYPANTRFLVVASEELLRMLRGKWSRRLMYLASVPFIVMVAIALFKGVLASASKFNLPVNPIIQLMNIEATVMALLAASAGAGIIAEDRKSRSLVLYLSRPLSPARYAWGKGLALWGLLSAVFWVPALVLSWVQAMVDPAYAGMALLKVMAGVVLGGGLAIAVITVVVMALSSLGNRRGYIGMAWIALYFFSDVVSHAVRQATDHASYSDWLSFQRLLKGTMNWVLHPTLDAVGPPLVLLGVGVLAGALLVWRLRRMMRTAVSA